MTVFISTVALTNIVSLQAPLRASQQDGSHTSIHADTELDELQLCRSSGSYTCNEHTSCQAEVAVQAVSNTSILPVLLRPQVSVSPICH